GAGTSPCRTRSCCGPSWPCNVLLWILTIAAIIPTVMEIAIIGAGIAGLTLALNLHKRGLTCRVYETAPELKELGVGITLLPHAMREFAEVGLDKELIAQGIENEESRFYNRFGQLLYKEKRGRFAGYPIPEVGIHRATLHMTLYRAACARLGADRILL